MKKYEVTLTKEDGFPMTNKDGYPLHRHKIEAESPEQAFESFIKSHKPIPFGKINITWNYGLSDKNFDPPHYEGHKSNEDFEKEKDSLELKNQEEAKKEESSSQESLHHSDNFQPILHKLDEIHSTMKAIRWTIAGGFLFIILVISGIINPGIFG